MHGVGVGKGVRKETRDIGGACVVLSYDYFLRGLGNTGAGFLDAELQTKRLRPMALGKATLRCRTHSSVCERHTTDLRVPQSKHVDEISVDVDYGVSAALRTTYF